MQHQTENKVRHQHLAVSIFLFHLHSAVASEKQNRGIGKEYGSKEWSRATRKWEQQNQDNEGNRSEIKAKLQSKEQIWQLEIKTATTEKLKP